MKKALSLLLLLALAFSFAACGEGAPDSNGTDSAEGISSVSSDASVDTSVDSATDTEIGSSTDKNTDTNTSTTLPNVQLYDPDLEHKVIMDDSGKRILVADLNLCGDDPENIDMADCIIWEWSTDDAKGSSIYGKTVNLDEAGIRYSAYWKRDVVIFCGSSGWVGIVDYNSKELLFEDKPGKGPHSVELLPNGDLLVACSGNSDTSEGRVLLYPLSKGKTKSTSQLSLKSAHGVCWDPTNEVIWVLGGDEIIACRADGEKLTRVEGMGVSLKKLGYNGGHDLVPVYGQPGRYYVSCSKKILLFDANEGVLADSFVRSTYYKGASVKGIAWFSDGTMVISAHDQGGTGTYRSAEFRFLYLAMSSGKVKTVTVKEVIVPHRDGSQTYKIHTFSKDYQ